MANQKNINSVAKLTGKTKKAKAVVFTDYRGLTHKQLEEMRRALRKVNGDYSVSKNTLLKIALNESEFKPLVKDSQFLGTTGLLFAYEDEIAPVRELYKFSKATGFPKIKLSFFGKVEYDEAQTTRIATLPSKEGLIAQLMFTMNANTQKLAYLLTQIKK